VFKQVISELRIMGYFPYEITQCYLPPDTSEQTDWCSTDLYPKGMEG